jgi:hypothetical protein
MEVIRYLYLTDEGPNRVEVMRRLREMKDIPLSQIKAVLAAKPVFLRCGTIYELVPIEDLFREVGATVIYRDFFVV